MPDRRIVMIEKQLCPFGTGAVAPGDPFVRSRPWSVRVPSFAPEIGTPCPSTNHWCVTTFALDERPAPPRSHQGPGVPRAPPLRQHLRSRTPVGSRRNEPTPSGAPRLLLTNNEISPFSETHKRKLKPSFRVFSLSMKSNMAVSRIPWPCTSTMKTFHSLFAINGIPLKNLLSRNLRGKYVSFFLYRRRLAFCAGLNAG